MAAASAGMGSRCGRISSIRDEMSCVTWEAGAKSGKRFVNRRNLTLLMLLVAHAGAVADAPRAGLRGFFRSGLAAQKHAPDMPQLELSVNTAEQRLVRMRVGQGGGGSQPMDVDEPKPMAAAQRAVVVPPSRPWEMLERA